MTTDGQQTNCCPTVFSSSKRQKRTLALHKIGRTKKIKKKIENNDFFNNKNWSTTAKKNLGPTDTKLVEQRKKKQKIKIGRYRKQRLINNRLSPVLSHVCFQNHCLFVVTEVLPVVGTSKILELMLIIISFRRRLRLKSPR